LLSKVADACGTAGVHLHIWRCASRDLHIPSLCWELLISACSHGIPICTTRVEFNCADDMGWSLLNLYEFKISEYWKARSILSLWFNP